MKAHEFAVIIAGSAVLFFGGALIVGTQFMKKTYEYGSEWVEATDEKEGRRRAEKIAYAQDANTENHQTKLLREQLEKARYGKRTTRQDLEKLLRTSDEELKIWYYAEDAEDIDQVRAYISYYAEKAETFRLRAESLREDLKKSSETIEKLEQRSAGIAAGTDKLAVALGEQKRRAESAVALRDAVKKEYVLTPTFRRGIVKKKLQNRESAVAAARKKIASLEALREKLRAAEQETETEIRVEREKQDGIRSRLGAAVSERRICLEAQSLTEDALRHTEDILRIKNEIMESETAVEDKKINTYF